MLWKTYLPRQYDVNKIERHLIETNDYFIPPTSDRVDIKKWARKLYENATIFELSDGEIIVGLGALYFNQAPDFSYGTHVCVLKEYQDGMYGIEMMIKMVEYAQNNGSEGYRCEIRKSNRPLVKFYKSLGFTVEKDISLPDSNEIDLIISKKFINGTK